jgi:hypothetical protein
LLPVKISSDVVVVASLVRHPFCYEQNFSVGRVKKAKQHYYSGLQGAPKSRPTGVTIITILVIIGGIVMLLIGLGFVTVGLIIPLVPQSEFQELQQNLTADGDEIGVPQVPPFLIGGGFLAIGGMLIVIAIFSFVVAYGLLKGKSWAWTLTIVLSIISIAGAVISTATTGNFFNIINIIISGIIIYYLYRPHVKAYFGKGTRTNATPAA